MMSYSIWVTSASEELKNGNYVVLGGNSYPVGKFAVDAMNLSAKTFSTIRESVFQSHRRILTCLEEHRRKELLFALNGIRTLTPYLESDLAGLQVMFHYLARV